MVGESLPSSPDPLAADSLHDLADSLDFLLVEKGELGKDPFLFFTRLFGRLQTLAEEAFQSQAGPGGGRGDCLSSIGEQFHRLAGLFPENQTIQDLSGVVLEWIHNFKRENGW